MRKGTRDRQYLTWTIGHSLCVCLSVCLFVSVTGHLRPILYTLTTPTSPSDCLPHTHTLLITHKRTLAYRRRKNEQKQQQQEQQQQQNNNNKTKQQQQQKGHEKKTVKPLFKYNSFAIRNWLKQQIAQLPTDWPTLCRHTATIWVSEAGGRYKEIFHVHCHKHRIIIALCTKCFSYTMADC